MNQDDLESQLKQLGKIISDKMGIDFADRRLPDLRRGIQKATKELGHKDWMTCLSSLLTAPLTKDTIKVLATHLTIGETYFFRDEKLFKAMEQRILPDIIQEAQRANKVIRIWCAGCSTGEEPYSLAILLRTLLGDMSTWNVTILGTDINAGSLRRAREGVYTEWSFRGTPDWWKKSYFIREPDGRYRLANDIKKLVTFSYHNLVEDPFPSLSNNTNAMHIILCRNVLMYFNATVRHRLVQSFQASLLDHGWLIVSPAESALIEHPSLKKVTVFGTIAHQKASAPVLHDKYCSTSHALSRTTPLTVEPLPQTRIDAAPGTTQTTSSHRTLATTKPHTQRPQHPTDEQNLNFDKAERLYAEGRYHDLLNTVISRNGASSQPNIKDVRILVLLARAFANTGSLGQAEQWCREAIKRERANPSHHFLLATILQEVGAHEEAVKALKTAVYLDQAFVPAHFALANLEKRQGNVDASRRHLRNILKLLENFGDDQPIPESEGMTAGRMREIVNSIYEESES